MRIMERVKSMIRNWLEIQPASAKGFTIREPISFETNVMRNRIWYRGDASELDQLFKALAEDTVCNARFWAAAPQDENIRKAHSGLPGIMVDTFVAIVAADLDAIDFDGDEHAAGEWEQIAKENKLPITAGSDSHRQEDIALSGILSENEIKTAEDYVDLLLANKLEIIGRSTE